MRGATKKGAFMLKNHGNHTGGGESGCTGTDQDIADVRVTAVDVNPSTVFTEGGVCTVNHKVDGPAHSCADSPTETPDSLTLGQAFASVAGSMAMPSDDANVLQTASRAAMQPPGTVPPAQEVDEPPVPYRRSPLRNGTALDGLVPDRPLLNSLLERSDLRQVEPPIDPSTDFTRCHRFVRQLKKATETVVQCDTFELAAVGRTAIAQFHQPSVKEICDRKLAYHIAGDPIDPVVIFIEAIRLVHRVLHEDASGNSGLDLDGVAYIIERLCEAESLRSQEQDIRFNVLQALSSFLVAIIAKAEEECWACVEAA